MIIWFAVGCSADQHQTTSESEQIVATTAAMDQKSGSMLTVKSLPGRRLRFTLTARETPLYIVNCNQHIAPSLFQAKSGRRVWGGASDACLSQNIIVPAKASLSFTTVITEEENEPLGGEPLFARVSGVLTSPDLQSAPVDSKALTSTTFQLLP